jgi:hypothetical protein
MGGSGGGGIAPAPIAFTRPANQPAQATQPRSAWRSF